MCGIVLLSWLVYKQVGNGAAGHGTYPHKHINICSRGCDKKP